MQTLNETEVLRGHFSDDFGVFNHILRNENQTIIVSLALKLIIIIMVIIEILKSFYGLIINKDNS